MARKALGKAYLKGITLIEAVNRFGDEVEVDMVRSLTLAQWDRVSTLRFRRYH